MQVELVPFPGMPHPDIAITVEIARVAEGMFVVRYSMGGDISSVRLPEPTRSASRQDDLWHTTCFEAFARTAGDAYLEFNFAASTNWAAYRFTSYREGREDLPIPAPHFDVDRLEDRVVVTVAVDTTEVADLNPEMPWRFNLSAVIEETDGTKSYWALAHPPGKPDFHHPDCFVLELPPAD